MILGLTIEAFVKLHVVISLAAIASGIVALSGLSVGKWWSGWQTLFLVTTLLTSVTGFLFPFSGITPAFAFGVLSMILLAIALSALPRRSSSRAARTLYAIAATLALYLNAFVLVVQSFQKLSVLQPLAPTQTEPAFVIAQVMTLIAAALLGGFAVRSGGSNGLG